MLVLATALAGAYPLREEFVPVTGGRVYTCTVGPERSGAPLLVLHGGPGASFDYLEPLAALDRPVVFYDQLGCGRSEHPDDVSLWTVERYVQELAQVRAALGLERVHLLGQSWGAMLAVEYLLRQNATGVLSCTLGGPCLDAAAWEADQRRLLQELPPASRKIVETAEQAGNYDGEDYQRVMQDYYALHVCRLAQWPECLMRSFEQMNTQIYLHMWGPSEFTVTGTLKGHSCVEGLGRIDIPVLLTCGRYDEATPETVALFRDALPDARMQVFEDAAHEHHLEKTDEYLQALSNFLAEIEAGEARK